MEVHYHIEFGRWQIQGDFAATVGGWCACPGQSAIYAVEAYVQEKRVATAPMEERADVQTHFHGDGYTLRSGFTLLLPVLELETIVELRAVTSTGPSLSFYSFRFGDLPNRDAFLFDYPQWAQAKNREEARLAPPPPSGPPSGKPTPLISLLLPVYNPPLDFFVQCIESVIRQAYSQWELQIVDDGSAHEELKRLLRTLPTRDSRIQVTFLPRNSGISHATNHALSLAKGEFVGCVDHDDRLHPHALAEVVHRLSSTGALAVYTDEEKITADGQPHFGFFKPAFSPEFLRGVMYLGHFLCVRTSVARAVGGFNPVFDGVQDFEFALRLSEHTDAIEHIPRILYQWRMSPSSSALTANVKGDMDKLQAEAVNQHLARLGRAASAQPLGGHRVRLLPRREREQPKGVLVARTQACLENVSELSGYRTFVLSQISLPGLIELLERSDCDRLVWLNEPVTLASASSVDVLLELLEDDSVGAAAPVLLAPDGKVFAAGVVITREGKLAPGMRGFSAAGDGYHGSLRCNREVSAVLSTCVAFRRRDLLRLLSASAHPLTDSGMAGFCQALRQLHLRVLVCAAVQWKTPREWAEAQEVGRVAPPPADDPYYNAHFDATTADYRLIWPQKGGQPGPR